MSKKAKLIVAAVITAASLGAIAPANAEWDPNAGAGLESDSALRHAGENPEVLRMDLRERELDRVQDRNIGIFKRDAGAWVGALKGVINPR